jgi:hypothetical protein
MTEAPNAVAADDAAIAAQIERRRRAAVERWQLDDQVVLIGAGDDAVDWDRADAMLGFGGIRLLISGRSRHVAVLRRSDVGDMSLTKASLLPFVARGRAAGRVAAVAACLDATVQDQSESM